MSEDSSDLVDPKLQKAIYMITELAHTIMKLPTEDISLMVNLSKQCIADACDTHEKCRKLGEELQEQHGSWDAIPEEDHLKLYEMIRSEVQDFLTASSCMALAAAWNPTIDSVSLDRTVLDRMAQLTAAMHSILDSSPDEELKVDGLIRQFLDNTNEDSKE